MYREALNKLIKWKDSSARKPLIIRGARQVGKTWLMKKFGESEYPRYAYINFENNERMRQLFHGNLDIPRIIRGLQLESGVRIDSRDTLIIFDEVQEVPAALTSLKYFSENAPEFHVIGAGSMLGIAMHQGAAFPVGKVTFMDLYPLNFSEYLKAMNRQNLIEALKENDFSFLNAFKNLFFDALKEYYFVGGMPEVVSAFAARLDYFEVRSIQQDILQGYEQDFSKHAPSSVVPRIRMLWNSIPAQLAREQKKFIYGLIKTGARAREYEIAMTWLIDCGLIYKINCISKPGMPPAAYAESGSFKLFLIDVGLLGALSNLDAKSIIRGNTILEEFKGALTEQYVLQQFVCNKDIQVYYWTAPNAKAEIDFVIQISGAVIPVEVKAAENPQAKSLKSYIEKYNPKLAIRTSMSDYREEVRMVNVPLYSIGYLPAIITKDR